MNKDIYLCAISNVKSGKCSEDCSFCTQSAHHYIDIDTYGFKSIEVVVREAKRMKRANATGFCLVSANKAITDGILNKISQYAKAIKKEVDINLIACNGMATLSQLKELKDAGIDSYNHNLESSADFYKTICSTHSWESRFQTCINAKEAGLKVCSGGIFGMGESAEDRKNLIVSLKELELNAIAINLFHPNPQLPLKTKTLEKQEALDIISFVRSEVKSKKVMLAGGREMVFGNDLKEIFEAGANSIVIGSYLTTKGNEEVEEISTIRDMGYNIMGDCSE